MISTNPLSHIRNFAIVAHVDHGKSTLADRFLEITKTIPPNKLADQMLDTNPIEKERKITIKLAPVRMKYELPAYLKRNFNFNFAILNLIDTPGHVDFSYEVSRSLSACEGVILLVDATQGIQAQTLAYMKLVKERKLSVVPVINKIDSPLADINSTRKQLVATFNFSPQEIIEISARKGTNIDSVTKAIMTRIPPPHGDVNDALKAMVFSSLFDTHLGVIVFVRIFQGEIKTRSHTEETLMFINNRQIFKPIEIGYFSPQRNPVNKISCGEVGYIATGLKNVHLAQVGDTITFNPVCHKRWSADNPLPGFKKMKPMVFQRIFPVNSEDFIPLREALEKLHLSDSSFTFQPTSSTALGKGFNCGFLGLLHADVVQERLEREFSLNLIKTTPNIEYQIELKNGEKQVVQNASELPNIYLIKAIKEPLLKVNIYSPKGYVGLIIKLVEKKRGKLQDMIYLVDQVKFVYTIPLAELISNFFGKLKSISKGYASLDYDFFTYQKVNIVKLDILVNNQRIDALSTLVVKDQAYQLGRKIVDKLKEIIPPHQFAIPIQAAIGSNIVARSTIKALRKDVTAKLYGGDRSRKDKLLEKQKRGKKRLKQVGKVPIPQEAFFVVKE